MAGYLKDRSGRVLSWRGSPRRLRRIRLRSNWSLGAILFLVLMASMFGLVAWMGLGWSREVPPADADRPYRLKAAP